MIELSGMMPGCMTPFGLKEGLIQKVAVDKTIYNEQKLILAFGSETMSVEMTPNDLQTILEDSYKDIIYLEE